MLVRGAPLIGATAAYGVALAMRADGSDANLAHAVAVLGATRPTAINLRWALARIREQPAYAALNGDSTTARLCDPATKLTLRIPSTSRSLSAGTFMGPGEAALPGAGCGKAVDIAEWNVTFPSTFCIT